MTREQFADWLKYTERAEFLLEHNNMPYMSVDILAQHLKSLDDHNKKESDDES